MQQHLVPVRRFGKRPGFAARQLQQQEAKRQKKEEPPSDEPRATFGANNYSNDGSFLEKFYKMQGMKGEPPLASFLVVKNIGRGEGGPPFVEGGGST